MLSREGKQTDRGAVGAEFIGYNRRRREALLLQEFPHQPNCRPSVPAGLNQEIQDFALTVHGTPEIELPPSNYDDHLVQVPAFGRSWPPTLNPPRIGPTEFQDPSSNCLIRDVETTLGKQVLNVPIAQRETAIEPDGMLDDDRWKAVTTVGYLAHPETLKHRPCRSHAVNVTMPSRRTPSTTSSGIDSTRPSRRALTPAPSRISRTMSSPDKSRACQLSPVGLYLAPGAAHRVLADLAPEQAGQRSADTARVGAGKVRIGDNRLGPFGQPLVGLDGLAPPFLLTAIPIEQADAGERNRQRSEGADKLPMPVAVAITLGRAAALIARTAAQRRLRFLRHHSLDEGADAKADRILQGIESILTGKWDWATSMP